MNTAKSANQEEYRIIGYATDASIAEIIPYGDRTHINYAFLHPNSDGTIVYPANLWKLERTVELAHQADVKVLISVGCWGWDEQFEILAADEKSRERFVDELIAFSEQYNLDGIDMDWEYADPGDSSQNFLHLMRSLREKMTGDKLLTVAVVAYRDHYGLGIPQESFPLMDFVNLMTYDGDAYSFMAQAEQTLSYWRNRGLPQNKAVLGLPFYRRPGGASYWKIVEDNPEAAYLDEYEYLGETLRYNGIPTIQEKTRLAIEQVSGVMFWTIDHDDKGD